MMDLRTRWTADEIEADNRGSGGEPLRFRARRYPAIEGTYVTVTSSDDAGVFIGHVDEVDEDDGSFTVVLD